ncbi:hypothetical protein HIM_09687 [Hirsutella minnesotensis 3608]|uniref:Uncharacterized protein n=1 Tax=Hirsutella minnesotensis 3608 TaxID=1043627 RepID=A0A0F7ZGI2_9HYPO|nr:hypothetical protein HIM_09687 [Hirsutella minnesotensis 3608]
MYGPLRWATVAPLVVLQLLSIPGNSLAAPIDLTESQPRTGLADAVNGNPLGPRSPPANVSPLRAVDRPPPPSVPASVSPLGKANLSPSQAGSVNTSPLERAGNSKPPTGPIQVPSSHAPPRPFDALSSLLEPYEPGEGNAKFMSEKERQAIASKIEIKPRPKPPVTVSSAIHSAKTATARGARRVGQGLKKGAFRTVGAVHSAIFYSSKGFRGGRS